MAGMKFGVGGGGGGGAIKNCENGPIIIFVRNSIGLNNRVVIVHRFYS